MKDYMRDITAEEAINAGHTDTLCWDCKLAMVGGCSWTNLEMQKPVRGWKAIKTGMGYRVLSCPKFERETYGYGRYRTADDYILALETALTTRKKQVDNIKKQPDLFRKQNTTLKMKNKKLQDDLFRLEWFYMAHMND